MKTDSRAFSASSWGRDGLVIATATGVHPSYSGIITLEISNVGEIPVYLYPGLAIAQLFLQEVTAGIETTVGSIFAGSCSPRSATAAIKDKGIIKKFRANRGSS